MSRQRAALALFLGVALCSSAAHAGNNTETQAFAQGTALAKQGRFREAIAEFRKADAAEPQARHDCYIALAYARLDRWGLAEMHLSRCFERAGRSGALPPWTARLRGDIAAAIERTGLVRVGIHVDPPVSGARVTVSAFGPDEPFAPRTVYLPRGNQLIEASAPGRVAKRKEISIESGRARDVIIRLDEAAGAGTTAEQRQAGQGAPGGQTARTAHDGSAVPGAHPAVPVAERPAAGPVAPAATLEAGKPAPGAARGWTWVALGVGAAGLAGGLTFHILAYANQDKLASAQTLAEYRKHEGSYDVERVLTYSSYAVAAVGIGAGIYLYLHRRHREEERAPVVITGGTDGRTALVQLRWIH